MAGLARAVDDAPPLTLRIHLTDLDRDLLVEVADGRSAVTFAAPGEPADIHAKAGDLVDFATGRKIDGELHADPTAIAFLSRLATVMSSSRVARVPSIAPAADLWTCPRGRSPRDNDGAGTPACDTQRGLVSCASP